MINLNDAREEIKFCDSYSRLISICELEAIMEIKDWLVLLGENWSGCDNIFKHHEYLEDIFLHIDVDYSRQYMMTTEEKLLFNSLPEKITIYRGCSSINMLGMSWSLSKAIAQKIPTLNRYLPANKESVLIIETTISKHDALAIKTDRDEQEVIVCPTVFLGMGVHS